MTRSRNTADVYSEGTLLDIANAQSGTATFSSDVYTFTTLSGEYPTLQAGMSISFKLPTGSVNTTTTPTISYNSTEYTIKWIDGSALAASDLDVTYNKHPISFYFDGTDMLIASDICGEEWCKFSNGIYTESRTSSSTIAVTTSSSYGGFLSPEVPETFLKTLAAAPSLSVDVKLSGGVSVNYNSVTSTGFSWVIRTISSSASATREVSYIVNGRWY